MNNSASDDLWMFAIYAGVIIAFIIVLKMPKKKDK
jgi:hypothetical protein